MLLSRGILDDPLLSTATFRPLALSGGPNVGAKATMELMQYPAPFAGRCGRSSEGIANDMDGALSLLCQLDQAEELVDD